MTSPHLTWDIGTAYDLFISLHLLHHPAKFGLRGSWAVGVRSRLPQEDREFLQEAMEFLAWPLSWIYQLPSPKDGRTALQELHKLPDKDVLVTLGQLNTGTEHDRILLEIVERGSYTAAEVEFFIDDMVEEHGKKKSKKMTESLELSLSWWAQAEEFGTRLKSALNHYYESFFAEDEARIRPALEAALVDARGKAEALSIPELLEELSQGVQFREPPKTQELVLAPSFWGSPFLLLGHERPERQVILFGGRPADASLVPGEMIPDALYQALKALADPTRLRILNYLMQKPMTPTTLAKKLRLRAPTVIHHLQALRLARLVTVRYGEEGKRYQARYDAVQETYALLDSFLGVNDEG